MPCLFLRPSCGAEAALRVRCTPPCSRAPDVCRRRDPPHTWPLSQRIRVWAARRTLRVLLRAARVPEARAACAAQRSYGPSQRAASAQPPSVRLASRDVREATRRRGTPQSRLDTARCAARRILPTAGKLGLRACASRIGRMPSSQGRMRRLSAHALVRTRCARFGASGAATAWKGPACMPRCPAAHA